MKRQIMTLAVSAAVMAAVPATATKPTDKPQSAAQACKDQRTQMGKAAFNQLYGTNKTRSNAFGKCVSKVKAQKPTAAEQEQTVEAAQTCRDEQKADRKAFADKYGTNHNKRNAFGKCVSQQEKTQQPTESS
jgi:hypothetical protein